MAPIPVDRIISISSEEQTNKGENILNNSDSHHTWRCKAGDKQATIILQLLKPSVISSIDVGNDNSAFIEIFVGKSTSSDEFQVLLVTSSLMTLNECKNGLNVNKVRFFDTDQLSPASKESWDRVKIVCTQPYVKQAKFGLSFITFHSKDVPKKEEPAVLLPQSVQLGSFTLKCDDDSDDISSAGRLFAKRHEEKKMVRMPESPVSRLLAIHKKNLDAAKNRNTDSKNNNSPPVKQKIIKSPKDSSKHNKIDLNVQNNNPSTSSSIQNTVARKRKSDSSPSIKQSEESSRKKIKLTKNPLPVTKPFGELLNNVTFAMSGYENPYRANLRSKALEMGAIYKHNWNQSCTHLICAFVNTPKYNEAKRQGAYRIVKSNWIDKCHSNRCRFPWRRFALDKTEENKPESEDEIHELIESVQNNDTDDEWNDVSSKPVPSTSQTNNSNNPDESIFDADTDIDSDLEISEDILTDKNPAPLPIIDNVFHNQLFYLSTGLKPSLKKECHRYIIALDGKLSTKDKCDYIISTEPNDLKLPNTVAPQWIWDCYDAKRVLPRK